METRMHRGVRNWVLPLESNGRIWKDHIQMQSSKKRKRVGATLTRSVIGLDVVEQLWPVLLRQGGHAVK